MACLFDIESRMAFNCFSKYLLEELQANPLEQSSQTDGRKGL